MNKPFTNLAGAASDRTGVGPALLLAGMHRSGTSALARVISLLGAELPRTLMAPSHENPKGYWESDAVAALNDELLAEVGAAWDDPLVFLTRREELSSKPNVLSRIGRVVGAEYALHGPTVIKDPRMALLLDAWLAAAARERLAPRVIVPFRDPLEVAASLNARNGFSYGRSLLLWLSYTLSAEKSSRGAPRAFAHYGELLLDWRSVLRGVEERLDVRLPGWTPAAEIEVDAFLSRADRHHVSPPGLLHARADVVSWVKLVYEWMLGAATGEALDTSVLDGIAAEFAASTRVFAPVIAEHAAGLSAARASAAAAQRTLARLEAEKRELEAKRDILASDVEINRTRADALEALAPEVEALRARVSKLDAEVAERDARLGETQARLAASESAAKQESALALQWRTEATALRREVADFRINDARQAAHIESLEASVRAAIERADREAGERRDLHILAASYRDFIERSVPLARRLRRLLWRRPLLRPLSFVAEFAILAARRGPVAAAKSILAAARLRQSGEFDENYYLERAWDVRALGQDPVVHYVAAGASEGRDPSPGFCTKAYCRRYRDVARAGANPLLHYIRHGRREGRAAFAACADGTSRTPTASEIDPYALRPDDVIVQEAERGAAYMQRFRLLAADPDWAGAVAALNAISGPHPGTPVVSVVVPVHGQLAYTLNCLDALLSHRSRHPFEVIVVDDCSADASREWLPRVRGIRRYAREANGGFIQSCNDGARQARGQWLVFLNNDTRVVAGWLDALIDSFASLADAELVGSKLFYPDGSLQEAGCIIWRDGSAWNFGRNDDPGKPEFCYARPVDYVSGASIAISRAVWEEIGGFDLRYAPAYAEDSDLALKVRHVRGKKVWMQPMSRVIHYEGKTSGIDTARGVKAYQVRNAKTLYRTWTHALAGHRENGDSPLLEKDRGVAKRALVLDAGTPEPDKDAGSLTCIELMRALQQAGYKVTFAPAANLLYLPTATTRLQRDGIEALYYPYTPNLEEFLRKQGDVFDLVMMFRLEVAEKWSASVRSHCPHARMIFHCSDLHFLREQRQAELRGDAAAADSAEQTKARELAVIGAVDATIVHSSYEQDLLAQAAPSARVYVFPWILEPLGRSTPFHLRKDIAFLGGYRHAPNVDAVLHFARSVWPLIRERRPDMKFIIAGSECPEELRALHGRENVEVVGFVEDLAEFFGKVRFSVAPIRYGAGIKGKVAMSLAHGVPVVLTPCAAEGMGLRDGEATLIRQDDAAFAEAVLAIYDDEARWMCMSERALKFVDATYGAAVSRRRIRELLALAGAA